MIWYLIFSEKFQIFYIEIKRRCFILASIRCFQSKLTTRRDKILRQDRIPLRKTARKASRLTLKWKPSSSVTENENATPWCASAISRAHRLFDLLFNNCFFFYWFIDLLNRFCCFLSLSPLLLSSDVGFQSC